jgi:hypothetical protein
MVFSDYFFNKDSKAVGVIEIALNANVISSLAA